MRPKIIDSKGGKGPMADPIGVSIRILRTQAGMTQEELAARLHLTRQAISNYERGRTHPDIDQLKDLADIFQVDLESLIYGTTPARNRRKVLVHIGCVLLVLFVLLIIVLLFSSWNREAAREAAVSPWFHWLAKTVLVPLITAGGAGCLTALLLLSGQYRLHIRTWALRGTVIVCVLVTVFILVMDLSSVLLAACPGLSYGPRYEHLCVSVFMFFFSRPALLYLIAFLTGISGGTLSALRRSGR
jgi:transcriptional regulator with XRE-family HTH domain